MAKRPGLGKKVFAEMAGALKMDPKALRRELAKGKSIAEVATEKGVNPTSLASQIVAVVRQGDQRPGQGQHAAAGVGHDDAATCRRESRRSSTASGVGTSTQVAPKTTSPATSVGAAVEHDHDDRRHRDWRHGRHDHHVGRLTRSVRAAEAVSVLPGLSPVRRRRARPHVGPVRVTRRYCSRSSVGVVESERANQSSSFGWLGSESPGLELTRYQRFRVPSQKR